MYAAPPELVLDWPSSVVVHVAFAAVVEELEPGLVAFAAVPEEVV